MLSALNWNTISLDNSYQRNPIEESREQQSIHVRLRWSNVKDNNLFLYECKLPGLLFGRSIKRKAKAAGQALGSASLCPDIVHHSGPNRYAPAQCTMAARVNRCFYCGLKVVVRVRQLGTSHLPNGTKHRTTLIQERSHRHGIVLYLKKNI